MRERTAYRLAFAAVLAILPVQHYIKHRFGEPYPSLYMPDFSGAGVTNGRLQTESADIQLQLCDGRSVTLSPHQFFNTLPTSIVDSAMNWMFAPSTFNPRPMPRWKNWLIRYVSPGYGRRMLRAQGMSFIDEPTKRWIHDRVVARFGSDPKMFKALWYIDTYDLRKSFPARSRQLSSIVPVSFKACSR